VIRVLQRQADPLLQAPANDSGVIGRPMMSGSPNAAVAKPGTDTVGQVAQTPADVATSAAVIVGRVVKLDGRNAVEVVTNNGGGIYARGGQVRPVRQRAASAAATSRAASAACLVCANLTIPIRSLHGVPTISSQSRLQWQGCPAQALRVCD
jgi:hypothetical protein